MPISKQQRLELILVVVNVELQPYPQSPLVSRLETIFTPPPCCYFTQVDAWLSNEKGQ
jgi:hypothetical protein